MNSHCITGFMVMLTDLPLVINIVYKPLNDLRYPTVWDANYTNISDVGTIVYIPVVHDDIACLVHC